MLQKILVMLAASILMSMSQAAVPSAKRQGFEHLREQDLKADHYFLASDPQGRMSLQTGDDAATQWIAAEFAKAGLKPASEDSSGHDSYLQAVPLIEFRADRASSFPKFTRDGKTFEWYRPDMVGGFRDDVEINAPLVFAGYGITAPPG